MQNAIKICRGTKNVEMRKRLWYAFGKVMDMKKGISQETLKLIACATMLIDHVGAVFSANIALRAIGRIAFPIYCFLMAEGAHYTRNKTKYALRVLIGAIISELPFDFGLFGGFTLYYQNVMVTLLLALFAIYSMNAIPQGWLKPVAVIPFYFIADFLCTDYGGSGVLLACMFAYFRDFPNARGLQSVGAAVCLYLIGGYHISLFGIRIPLEMLGLLALVPIWLYDGSKRTASPWVQWAFYLFYPVHLSIIAIIRFMR